MEVMEAGAARSSALILAMDVGGSSIKSAVLNRQGDREYRSPQETPIDPDAPGDIVLGVFVEIIRSALGTAQSVPGGLAGIGIGMPGPCDYSQGISLMRHKYGGIYGMDLKQELRQRAGLAPTVALKFGHDASLFLLGEHWRGSAAGYDRIIGVTLGTGLGVAFMSGNKLVCKETGMPEYSIWNRPYENGIVEDYVSKRALIGNYKILAGQDESWEIDVQEIADRGIRARDPFSLQVFAKYGWHLGEAMKGVVGEFKPDCLVVGGQIAKAYSLFRIQLAERLCSVGALKTITPAACIDFSALYGAAKLVCEGL